jgi:hypothetical protein
MHAESEQLRWQQREKRKIECKIRSTCGLGAQVSGWSLISRTKYASELNSPVAAWLKGVISLLILIKLVN